MKGIAHLHAKIAARYPITLNALRRAENEPMTLSELLFPWPHLSKLKAENEELKARIKPFDHDNDGKPGGSVKRVRTIRALRLVK